MRFLSLLLAVVMVLGMFPVGHVHAAETVNVLSIPVTDVEADVEYELFFNGDRGVYAGTVTRNGHTGLDSGSVSATAIQSNTRYIWTLKAADNGGYRIYNANQKKYIKIAQNTASIVNEDEANIFDFTYDAEVGAFAIKAQGVEYGYLKNLGGNVIGGGNAPDTKIVIRKVLRNHTHDNEVDVPAVEPTLNSAGLTAGTICADCGATMSGRETIPALDCNIGAVPKEAVTVTAGNEHSTTGNEGPAKNVYDNNRNTLWHTSYNNAGQNTSKPEDRWLDFALTEDYYVTGLIYKGRSAGINGNITKYEITISTDGGNTYAEPITGDWADDGKWQEVKFKEPVLATNVRLLAAQSIKGYAAAVEVRLIGTKHEHNWGEGAVITEPTLESEGVKTYTCSVCGNTKTESIPKLIMVAQPLMEGWEHGTVSLAECEYTFTKNGYAGYSVCHGGNYYVNANDGTPQTNVLFNTLTLGDQDNKIKFMKNGSLFMYYNGGNPYWGKVSSVTGNETDGTGAFYVLKANPNGSFEGFPGYDVITSRYNVVSGDSYLIAANFGDEWFIMYPSTEAVSIAKVVPGAVTHTHEYEVADPVDCGEGGNEKAECDCGHVHISQLSQEAHHGLTHVDAKVNTCTEDGNEEYWHCTNCDGYWLDEACTTTTTLIAVTIPATGHMYDAEVTAPTCTEDGYTTYTCTKCGESHTSAVVPALGHKYEVTAEQAATCTADGYTTYTCANCGDDYTVPGETATGHSYDDGNVTTAPTCTGAGVMTYTCSKCGDSYTEEIKATGHNYETIDGILSCTNCGETVHGVYEGRLYNKGVLYKSYQLVEFEGDFYFVNDYNKIAVNTVLYLSEEYVAGMTFDGKKAIPAGLYNFDENGKMLLPDLDKNGIDGDYFYINGVKQLRYQLIHFEGAYYFINDYDKIAKNTSLYLSEEFVKGSDLKAGLYDFGADGKLIEKHGVCGDYLYLDNARVSAYQMVKFNGNIYFVYDCHKLAKNCRLYLTERFASNILYGENIPVGYYQFDENGCLVMPEND